MPFRMPISHLQLWAFFALSLVFFIFLLRAFSRSAGETGSKNDPNSRLGILLQALGIAATGIGREKATLTAFSLAGLAGTLAVVLLMAGAIMLFATSSSALGRNWSIVARTRADHELVRSGPYARVRHPIYLGLLLYLFAFAVALGHWLQLVIALPLYLAGTQIRTRVEDRLLEESFGDVFRDYRNSTPALVPRLF
ncbi:MAG TPA: isoprenylcysteine carboxylmethyltransferase family protein [Sphingomicrobium sp.]|jgi:protein-S-isoprenylcysteine O-methyltransferase Ste14|nr:isoprenylcysteine carboxylmethyltransferase family protein [Sphingomicrobium sp.]